MQLPLVYAKQLEHGSRNPIVARLLAQPLELLNQCNIAPEQKDKVIAIYKDSLVKKLLRCWEIEQRLRTEFDKAVASHKPPVPGAVAVPLPQIPRLEEDCHNFLYEAKNYLRDLVQVFSILYGTKFKEASDWIPPPKGAGDSVMKFVARTFGSDHVNTRYLQQLPSCVAPYIHMRNAVEHPGDHSGKLEVSNITFTSDGSLREPTWRREKDGKTEYGPLSITREMEVGVHNLLVLGEDILVMWAMHHLDAPGLTEVTFVPESRRNPLCPIKYRITPSAAVLSQIASLQVTDSRARTAVAR